jgi:hypothetical protein
MTAEVLVLKYATVAVTGIDGRYRISGLPPGDLRVSAVLPSTGAMVERAIKIEGGKTVTADLEIAFDEKAYKKTFAAQRAADAGAKDTRPDASAGPNTKAPKPAASAKP